MLESCFVRPPARSRRTCFATPRPEMAGVDRGPGRLNTATLFYIEPYNRRYIDTIENYEVFIGLAHGALSVHR